MQEVWKYIEGYEGKYQVSNMGRVKSVERKVKHPKGGLMILRSRILKPASAAGGYAVVNLSKKNKAKLMYIHRAVALSFLDNPKNKQQVNHINGNKRDNSASNLEWCTPKENMKHASSSGLVKHNGSQSVNSKLKEKDVKKIRKEYSLGNTTHQKLSEQYNVCRTLITQIINRKVWKHI